MKHLFTLFLMLNGSALFAQIDSIEVDTAAVFPDSIEFQKAQHFFIELDYGYGLSHYNVIGNKYQELVDCRAEHETEINVPTAELKVGYQIKNWWNVSVGLQYFQTGFDFREEKTLSDTLPMEFVIGCEVYEVVDAQRGYVYNGFYDPRFASGIIGYHPTSAALKIKPRYHYMSVPLKTEVSADLLFSFRGRIRLFINGGLNPNYMIKQNYDQSYENGSWSYVLQDSIGIPSPYLRRWNMSAGFGVGVTFISVKRFEARAEFARQYQLLYLFDWTPYTKSNYQERHNIATLNVSVRYYLGGN